MSTPALTIRTLNVRLRGRPELAPLVRDINFELPAGQVTGLAGESGSGKSMTALAVMGLTDPRTISVHCKSAKLGDDQLPITQARAMRSFRGQKLSMVFQDPGAALDPVFTVGSQLQRTLGRLLSLDKAGAMTRALEALKEVGFSEPEEIASRHAQELSGGMRQLCLIAMARAAKPDVLIADEPTTALDASTQNLVLHQLNALARDHNTAVLFITHDLRLLTRHARQVMIMYQGRIVERTTGRALYEHPGHPYSAGLLQALPRLNRAHGERATGTPGQVPIATHHSTGCAFSPRCTHSTTRCKTERPELRALQSDGPRQVACHHPSEGNNPGSSA